LRAKESQGKTLKGMKNTACNGELEKIVFGTVFLRLFRL
jgi:hypothetical protein